MTRIINKLRRKDGASYPFIVCIVLVLFIITLGVCEVIRINIISANIRNKFQAAIITETTNNYSLMYQPLRDGYAASHQNSGSGWVQSSQPTENRIRNQLNGNFNTGEAGQLTVQNVSFTMHTAPLAPNDAYNAVQFNVRGQVIVEIPYRFLWRNLPPMQLTVNVNSTWRQMF
jgi:hypothetical protein